MRQRGRGDDRQEEKETELGGKLHELQVVDASLRQQTQALGPNKIASLRIETSTTAAQVLNVANIGLSRQLDEIMTIRTWEAEADFMEAESEFDFRVKGNLPEA